MAAWCLAAGLSLGSWLFAEPAGAADGWQSAPTSAAAGTTGSRGRWTSPSQAGKTAAGAPASGERRVAGTVARPAAPATTGPNWSPNRDAAHVVVESRPASGATPRRPAPMRNEATGNEAEPLALEQAPREPASERTTIRLVTGTAPVFEGPNTRVPRSAPTAGPELRPTPRGRAMPARQASDDSPVILMRPASAQNAGGQDDPAAAPRSPFSNPPGGDGPPPAAEAPMPAGEIPPPGGEIESGGLAPMDLNPQQPMTGDGTETTDALRTPIAPPEEMLVPDDATPMDDQEQTDAQERAQGKRPPCPDYNDLKPITSITNNIAPEPGSFPQECAIGGGPYVPRSFAPLTLTWKASALCHKPLYFEERALERYGHSLGPIAQPVFSGAHFIGSVFVLPYKMGMNPPWECEYALGYYRPGSCAPYIIPPVPISARGAVYQAGAVVGLNYLLP